MRLQNRMGDRAGRRIATSELVALALLLASTATFFLLWFSRFAGVRSGAGEFAGGMSILAGRIPYRDFYNPGPPLNALKAALLLKLFGTSLFVLRLAAVAERLLLAAMLYLWLRRLVSQQAAWIASLVTLVLSAGDRTDPLTSYNHDAILFGIGAAMCLDIAAMRPIGKADRSPATMPALAAAGALTALSALTKQTVGGCCAVFFTVWLLLIAKRLRMSTALALGTYSLGLLVPTLFLGLWLWHRHALFACVRMMFVEGPSAKAGGPLDFLTRTLLVAGDNTGWVVLGTFFLVLAWRPLLITSKSVTWSDTFQKKHSGGTGPVFAIFGMAMLLAVFLSKTHLPTLHDQSKSAVYFTLLALPLIGFGVLWPNANHDPERSRRLLLFAGTGLTTALSLSLSWPAFEAMLLPGLALPLALILDASASRIRRWVIALLVMAVFLQVREKLDVPFGFDYQIEAPVSEAHAVSTQPLLQGMRLPRQTVDFLDGSAALARHCLGKGETLFTYPEMGLLYALSRTVPPTLSPSHNIDVVNDSFARREAARLAANPPRILIYYPETEENAAGAERLWRRNKPSGQRDIVAAIQKLLPRYELVQRYRLSEADPEIGLYLLNTGNLTPYGCR